MYKIKDWETYYENNRSRTVKDLQWVPIPNKHDGEKYSRIVIHEKGAIIFSTWIILLQVASRCHPRGTLVRNDGKAHDIESLSIKTRAPIEWFKISIPYLVQVSWIEELALDCHDPVSVLSSSCQLPDEEGKKEGMERSCPNIEISDRYEIPSPLRVPQFMGAWDKWLNYRFPKGTKTHDQNVSLREQVLWCSKVGIERAVEAINFSVLQNYKGLFEPKSGKEKAKSVKSKRPTMIDGKLVYEN